MVITPKDFKQAFEAAFIVNRAHLRWDTSRRRTANMIAYIYRTLANSFPDTNVEHEYGEYQIDAVLYRNDFEHIDVGIEHENDVKSVAKELDNFAKHNFPLNVLITYTGDKNHFLINNQSEKMNQLCDRLLVIVNPENHGWWNDEQKDQSQHNLILWEYWLWTKNGFVSVD
jgi:hypothetical protein